MNVSSRSQEMQQQLWNRLVTHFHVDSTAFTPIRLVSTDSKKQSIYNTIEVYRVHYGDRDYYVDKDHHIYRPTHMLSNGCIGIRLY